MVYMLVGGPVGRAGKHSEHGDDGAMGAGPAVRFPTLALLFGAFMIGYTVMVTDRLSRQRPTRGDRTARRSSRRAPSRAVRSR